MAEMGQIRTYAIAGADDGFAPEADIQTSQRGRSDLHECPIFSIFAIAILQWYGDSAAA
jgi:hypothetical protein